MKTQTWPRAMHCNVVCLCVFGGSALLLLSQGGRWKSWSQLDEEDTPTAVLGFCLGSVEHLCHSKGFQVTFLRAFPLPCSSNQTDGALTAAVTHFRKKPLECSLSLQHHLHFSWSGWIFCRDSAQAVSFALGSPYKYSLYLKAHARSFAAGWLLFLLYFLLLVLNVCLGFGGWLHNTVFSLLQNYWANFKVMEEGEDGLMCWATFAHPFYDWCVIGTVDLRLPRICCQTEFFINWLLQSVLGCGKFNTFLTSSAQLVRRLL